MPEGPNQLSPAGAPVSHGESVASVFERIAREHAPATAASDHESDLTYTELTSRSGAIAEALIRRGLGPGGRVLIALPRGLEYLLAVVGVVRAGGVYVPVDPAWPGERLDQIMGIVKPSVVLARRGSGNLAGSLSLDELAGDADRFEPPRLGPESPCYIMFTSGTTGDPKGVVVPHRAVLRLVVDPSGFDVGPNRCWLHHSSTSFDASTLEIWAPLLNGGCCATVADSLVSIDRLAEILKGSGVTDVWLTASLFNAVVDYAPEAFSGLRQVLTGGERLSPDHVRRFMQRLPGVRLINGYGPTENTTFTCCHTVEPGDPDNPGGIPIGKPIRGTSVRIVDEQGNPVAEGEAGELLAGGAGVSLGYLDEEELTSSRFVMLADSSGPWYRTGDIVRRRPDGVIEYLGRRDRQVKIRGHRIELEEVEAQMSAHDSVGRAFAMVLGDRADLNRLAAAYTSDGDPIDPGRLRAWLVERVPGHLVPDVLCPLDEIPVGATGKVDLDAVRSLIGKATSASCSGDRDDAREDSRSWGVLVEMLGEILPGSAPSPDSSFLGIGGHSIAALRLAARISAEYGVLLPISRIIACDALGTLAEEIRAGSSLSPPADDSAVFPGSGSQPFEAASMQKQFFFEQALDPSGHAYHEFASFRAGPELDLALLEDAWRKLVERHEIFRTRYELRGEHLLQHVAPPDTAKDAEFHVHAPVHWGIHRTPPEVADVLNAPFDLEHKPPVRLHVFRLHDGSFGVVFAIHHMAVDEWSLDLIASELGTLYRGGSLPRPIPFRVYSEFEARSRSDDEIERVAGRLLYVSRGHTLLGRSPSPSVLRPVLADLTTRELADRARELECTPSAYLLAAYGRALCDVFERPDVAVLTPLSCRTRPHLQQIVGCCNTTHPILIDGGSFDTHLTARAVQHELIEAYQRPVAPFSDVIRSAQRQSRGRGFSVEFGFAFQTHGGFTPDLGEVRVGSLCCPQASARFPVALLMKSEGRRIISTLAASAGSEGESRLRDLEEAIEQRMKSMSRGRSIRVRAGDDSGSDEASPRIVCEPADEDPIRHHAFRAWQELLGSAPQSNEDNFFDRGGHSLLLLRLAAMIRSATGLELTMGPFLERPVFGRLINCLRDAQAASEQAGRTFRVVELRRGEQTILALPGAIGRPIVFNRLAREMTENDRSSPGLLAYDLCEPIEQLGPGDGLDRVLARLLGDLHRPDVCGVIGYSVGGLLPLFLRHIPPEIERRVHLWLVDVFNLDALRDTNVRLQLTLHNMFRFPHRAPLAMLDSARITRRLMRKSILRQEELGLDQSAIEKLRMELHRRSTRVWRGSATVFIAGRKPIWQPHFDESELNGMGPFLDGETRSIVIPHIHQDLLSRGARRIARTISSDLARKKEQ